MAWYLMFNFSMDCKEDRLVSREFIKLENIPEINNPEEYKRAVIDARSRWSNLQFTCKGSICSVSDSELVWREVLEIEEEKMDSMAEAESFNVSTLGLAEELEKMARESEIPRPDEIRGNRALLVSVSPVHDPDCTAEQ